GRTDELSQSVSRLREEVAERLEPIGSSPASGGRGPSEAWWRSATDAPSVALRAPPPPLHGEGSTEPPALRWLLDEVHLDRPSAEQLYEYLAAGYAAL